MQTSAVYKPPHNKKEPQAKKSQCSLPSARSMASSAARKLISATRQGSSQIQNTVDHYKYLLEEAKYEIKKLKDAQRSQSAQFRRAIEEEKRKRNSEMGKVIANNKAAQKEHKRILDSLNSVLRDKQRTIQTLIRKISSLEDKRVPRNAITTDWYIGLRAPKWEEEERICEGSTHADAIMQIPQLLCTFAHQVCHCDLSVSSFSCERLFVKMEKCMGQLLWLQCRRAVQ
ncbi:hypothetical protein Tcan_06322 [Toxocara canis]|uniref:Uncharacterized protein n=1 Tax=Toxocara canis TaxID=6265 RepID=A0A0B2VCD4_TOXCA|nr:hypothetical protein Tcan_06322 [Toxocara canis]